MTENTRQTPHGRTHTTIGPWLVCRDRHSWILRPRDATNARLNTYHSTHNQVVAKLREHLVGGALAHSASLGDLEDARLRLLREWLARPERFDRLAQDLQSPLELEVGAHSVVWTGWAWQVDGVDFSQLAHVVAGLRERGEADTAEQLAKAASSARTALEPLVPELEPKP